jgi:subtilisin family serine protease
VNVAVLDTGIDLQHPDLVHAIGGGYNTFNPAGSPQDNHKHGTHVAGIVAAANNAFGVVGVAPGAKLWAVKVLDHNGRGSTENVISGIDWVIDKKREIGGRWVINMSLGSNSPSDLEADIISRAYNEGIVLVAAAGNARSRVIDWPAAYVEVIAVSAVSEEGVKASFSSYGRGVSLAAPGVAIPSTILPDTTDSEASVTTASGELKTWGLTGSAHGTASAMIVDCGLGRPEDFTVDVRGNIALVQRGEIQFRAKARNAKLAGAAAVIIFNHEPEDPTRGWTLVVPDDDPLYKGFEFPITVAVSNATGKMLQSWTRPVSASYSIPQYGKLNGTSMSTPYVAGTVALMLSAAPDLNPAQVDWILRQTANDVGEPGWDEETAAGIADALAAAAYAAPSKFGVPPPPQPITPRRRSVRR